MDGPWSTFNLGVGEPMQSFRCLPGVNLPVLIIPNDRPLAWNKCNSSTDIDCRERAAFHSNASTTYRDNGIFSEWPSSPNLQGLDIFNSSDYFVAKDTIRFGHNASRDVGFASQYMFGTSSIDFFIGVFGLAPGKFGSSELESTLFSALAEQFAIPSASFSYSAGSAASMKSITKFAESTVNCDRAGNNTGSLVLGGYDTSRFDPNTTLNLPMPSNQNSTLVVHVQAIHLHGQTPVVATWLPPPGTGSLTFRIDSILPQIWLPIEACAIFEQAFGLVWNTTLAFYILDDATRSRLLKENPSVTFSVSDGGGRSATVKNFTLPYSAFDHQLFPPLVIESFYYFPLKRAANPLQYLLGRVFLQETYITVNYERANFSISQAYPAGGSGYVVPIPSKIKNAAQKNDSRSINRSPALYTGIGVAIGVAAIIAIGLQLSWKRQWGPFRKKNVVVLDSNVKPELHNDDVPRVKAMEKERAELPDRERVEAMERERGELETVEPRHEAGGLVSVHELEGRPFRRSESLSRRT